MSELLNKKEEKKKAELKVEPKAFDSTIECKLISSDELCKEVCKLFKGITNEFTGCMLRPVNEPYGTRFDLLAYFTPNNSDGFKVVKNTINNAENEQNKSMRILSKIAIADQGRVYELSDAAKEIFADLMYGTINGNGDKKVAWQQEVVEVKEDTIPYGVGGARQTVARLQVRFDMYKLLAKIYGEKSADGVRYEYMISIRNELAHTRMSMNMGGNSLINQNSAIPRNWVLYIERLDTNEVRKKANDWGYLRTSTEYSNIPMVTLD